MAPNRPFSAISVALTFLAALGLAALGLAALGLAAPTSTRAQAPPGPLPQAPSQGAPSAPARVPDQKAPVQPRTSLFGVWQLDPDDSDDPRKKMQEARGGQSNGGNRRMGGGYPGGGYPGGGGGGYGGRRMGSQGESDEDRQRLQELLNPAHTLTVAEAKKDVEVDLFDDQQRKRALFTDGRKPQKSKDANYQEISAHWDGPRLATEEKNPRGGKMSRTFELSYDGTQLYETLHMTVGRSGTPLVIRYVYQPSGALPPAGGTVPAPGTAPSPR